MKYGGKVRTYAPSGCVPNRKSFRSTLYKKNSKQFKLWLTLKYDNQNQWRLSQKNFVSIPLTFGCGPDINTHIFFLNVSMENPFILPRARNATTRSPRLVLLLVTGLLEICGVIWNKIRFEFISQMLATWQSVYTPNYLTAKVNVVYMKCYLCFHHTAKWPCTLNWIYWSMPLTDNSASL